VKIEIKVTHDSSEDELGYPGGDAWFQLMRLDNEVRMTLPGGRVVDMDLQEFLVMMETLKILLT
jgi:hypothetical protein